MGYQAAPVGSLGPPPVDCTSSGPILRAQHCCLSPNRCFSPPSAFHPPPRPPPACPSPIDSIRDITGSEKLSHKTSNIQIADRNSYKMIAIQLHYLYNISGLTVLYHKRRTVHSIFQIRISRNTKCAHKTGFPRLGHI